VDIKTVTQATREAEKIAVSAILRGSLNPHDASFTGMEFSSPDYRNIVLGSLVLTQDGSDVDLLSLSNYLAVNSPPEETPASPTVLANLAQMPIPANIRPAIQLIHTNKARTKLMELSANITAWADDESDPPSQIIDRVETSLDGIRKNLGQKVSNRQHLSQIAEEVVQQYNDMAEGVSHNIPTGWRKIDDIMSGGGAPGDTWLVGALTGNGKSAMALEMAKHQSRRGIPSLIFSREMRNSENFKRIHVGEADIANWLIRPQMNPEVHRKLLSTVGKVSNHNIWLDDKSATIPEIKREARESVEIDGVRVVYVDYLQLVSASDKATRAEEVAYCSRELKRLAMDLNVWIIILAQYNRQAAYSGEIGNHSFSDSGQIEKDASVILHLSLDKVEDPTRIPKWRGARIVVGKARNAPHTALNFRYRGETFTFEDASIDD
jgi:replicative DNA helicase